MFKLKSKDTRKTPLSLFWCLYFWVWTYFTPCSSISIFNFEHVITGWDTHLGQLIRWRLLCMLHSLCHSCRKRGNREVLTFHCVKCVQLRSFFWSVFSRIRTEYGPEKTPYLDTFHAVFIEWIHNWFRNSMSMDLLGDLPLITHDTNMSPTLK